MVLGGVRWAMREARPASPSSFPTDASLLGACAERDFPVASRRFSGQEDQGSGGDQHAGADAEEQRGPIVSDDVSAQGIVFVLPSS